MGFCGHASAGSFFRPRRSKTQCAERSRSGAEAEAPRARTSAGSAAVFPGAGTSTIRHVIAARAASAAAGRGSRGGATGTHRRAGCAGKSARISAGRFGADWTPTTHPPDTSSRPLRGWWGLSLERGSGAAGAATRGVVQAG